MSWFYPNIFNSFSSRSWSHLLILGVLMILIGLTIIILPEILIAFVASIFFMGGILFFYLAYKIHQIQKYNYEIKININE